MNIPRALAHIIIYLICYTKGFSFDIEDLEEYSCPQGSYRLDDFCYFVSSWSENYDNSELYCKMGGGNLAAVKSSKINTFLQKLNLKNQFSYWIDLNRGTEGNWVYSDGTEANYFKWGPGQPNNLGGKQNCVTMDRRRDFIWDDVDCNSEINYICQFSGTKCKHNKWPPTADTHCFELSIETATFEKATEQCKRKDGHLVKIDSLAMYEFITNIIFQDRRWLEMEEIAMSELIEKYKRYTSFVWIGLKRHEGKWMLSDGTVANFTMWFPDEPNNTGDDENCGGVSTKWNDMPCSIDLYFACQYKAKTTLNNQITSQCQSSYGKVIIHNTINISKK